MALHLVAFVVGAAFGIWMLSFVVGALRTGRIHHTDSTSVYTFRTEPIRFIFVACVFLAFAAVFFYFAFARWESFWQIDRCLDAGGRWDAQSKQCANS